MQSGVVRIALVTGLLTATVGGTAEVTSERPVRILLTSGGHGFPAVPFYAMFDALPGVVCTKAEMPRDAGLLTPGLEKQYDAIVMYDMVAGISADQQKAFVELLNTGIGLVSLHHNLGAHRDWDEFRRIVGGQYVLRPSTYDGKEYKPSTFSHDQQLKVQVVAPEHPVTRGVHDFEIIDEVYGGCYVAPGVQVLLRTQHPAGIPELAWVHTYGKSRVVYLLLGHDQKAYANESFRLVLLQAIQWTAGRR